MKKLLTILASISIISSSTTLVIACSPKKNILINLNDYSGYDLGIFEEKPDAEDIIDLFNSNNGLSLILDTDVVVEDKTITMTGAIIKAQYDSNKYQGEAEVTFSIKKNLNSFSYKDFGPIDKTPNPEDILVLFNTNNFKDPRDYLKLNADVAIDEKTITKTGAIIKAHKDSNKYQGEVLITFGIRINLKDYDNTKLGVLDQKPNPNKILDLFFKKNGIKLELDIDVTIDEKTITETGAIIMAQQDSNKYQGQAEVTFSIRKNLDSFSHKDFGPIDIKPSPEDILILFNTNNFKNPQDYLKLNIDVTIDEKTITETGAIIMAQQDSNKYQGQAEVTFGVRKNLDSFSHKDFGPIDIKPSPEDILILFNTNNFKNPQDYLKLNIDVTVDEKTITETGAIIMAQQDSNKYQGQAEVTFSIRKNLDSFSHKDFGPIDIKPSPEDILILFNTNNFKNPQDYLKLNIDVTIDEKTITETGAIIMAQQGSNKYQGQAEVTFGVRKNLSDFDGKNLGGQIGKPNSGKILDLFNKLNNTSLTLENDVIIDENEITETRTVIKAKQDSKKYQGQAEVTFELISINDNKTWYIDVNGITIGKSSSAPQETKEIIHIGYDEDGKAHKMPENVEIVPKQISSKILSLDSLFADTKRFNQDISNWNVSNIISMKGMFRSSAKFNQNIVWQDISKVTNMSEMFKNTYQFNGEIQCWNVSNVTDMSEMFYGARKFNKNLTAWTVDNVVNFNYFAGEGNSEFTKDKWPIRFQSQLIEQNI